MLSEINARKQTPLHLAPNTTRSAKNQYIDNMLRETNINSRRFDGRQTPTRGNHTLLEIIIANAFAPQPYQVSITDAIPTGEGVGRDRTRFVPRGRLLAAGTVVRQGFPRRRHNQPAAKPTRYRWTATAATRLPSPLVAQDAPPLPRLMAHPADPRPKGSWENARRYLNPAVVVKPASVITPRRLEKHKSGPPTPSESPSPRDRKTLPRSASPPPQFSPSSPELTTRRRGRF